MGLLDSVPLDGDFTISKRYDPSRNITTVIFTYTPVRRTPIAYAFESSGKLGSADRRRLEVMLGSVIDAVTKKYRIYKQINEVFKSGNS